MNSISPYIEPFYFIRARAEMTEVDSWPRAWRVLVWDYGYPRVKMHKTSGVSAEVARDRLAEFREAV